MNNKEVLPLVMYTRFLEIIKSDLDRIFKIYQ